MSLYQQKESKFSYENHMLENIKVVVMPLYQNVLEIGKKVKDFGSIYEIQITLIINFKEIY